MSEYFGTLAGGHLLADKPFVLWTNSDGEGKGRSYDSYSEAAEARTVELLRWRKGAGNPDDFPWAIYALLDGIWEIVDQYAPAASKG
jgi:hypothetical protein